MKPLPFEVLLSWILDEFQQRQSIFGIDRSLFYVPKPDTPFAVPAFFGNYLATPIGPAAGPQTQLAQNIVSAWLCSGRFIELKASGGVAADAFILEVSDGQGGTDTITVNVTIQPQPYHGSLLWNQSYDITYDGWVGVTSPSAFNGSDNLPTSNGFTFAAGIFGGGYRKATSGDFTFKPSFAFTQVKWITYRGPDQGKAQVLVDGKVKTTVDLYSATSQWQYLVTLSGLTNAKHTVIVRALNAKNALSKGKWVVVDGFKIGLTSYDDNLINTNKVAMTYGTWLGLLNPGSHFGAYRISGKANAAMSFSFDGQEFDWTTARGPAYGQAAIYLDGSLRTTVDLYNPTQQWGYLVRVVDMPYGHHTVVIKVLGTKNPASTGTGAVSDGFVIN